jgi:TRAP-type mannitol/chloroaromatic compound transport system substrate-binding protein
VLWKSTYPVGVPAPGGVTDTVAVTLCPFTLNATEVEAWFTVSVDVPETPAKFASPA